MIYDENNVDQEEKEITNTVRKTKLKSRVVRRKKSQPGINKFLSHEQHLFIHVSVLHNRRSKMYSIPSTSEHSCYLIKTGRYLFVL